MEWFVVATIGAVIGLLTGFFAEIVRMPQILCIVLGTIGAVLGGTLFRITRIDVFGAASFYLIGVLVAIGFLVGGILAYSLTNTERRV